jgi:hypothetical protein
MANEDKKDFNAMFHDSKDMPKFQTLTDEKSIKKYGADFTEPITAGIFVSIVAWASYQRADDKTPYWRTLKASGELNPKYPGGAKRNA